MLKWKKRPDKLVSDKLEELQTQLARAKDEIKALYAERANLQAGLAASQSKTDGIVKQLRTELSDSQRRADSLICAYRQKDECETLYANCRVVDAARLLSEIVGTASDDVKADTFIMDWLVGFQQRCIQALQKHADSAMSSQNYHEAVKHFSAILELSPADRDRADTLIKRSKAQLIMRSWEDALKDADEVIKLDSSTHRGYEQRHAALHGARRFAEAVEAFDTMRSKLDQSADEGDRELRGRYVDARSEIRRIIDVTVRDMPRVLINTATGCLHDRTQLAKAFEAHPLFMELVSSMTTEVDCALIRSEVEEFYRYVMLSHKWEHGGEPLFQDVEHISVYELKASRANTKLQTFCSTARSLGFRWAWSDTCCIDKVNKVILEESLVAMFAWYRGSSLILVHLLGVLSQSMKPGDLRRSVWNTRVWTFQEYLAADRVLFYTEDWNPYLDLPLSNHKESSIIISEMELVSQVPEGQLAQLQPGPDRVLEKLFLVSRRHATLVEDNAYSLLGIFNVSLPVIYGEGNRAIGRLLEHILMGSGDVRILAWTGTANKYNSSLPTDLTVYKHLVPPHIPSAMEMAEVDERVAELPSSLTDLSIVIKLYDRLRELPLPFLAFNRLRLPGIVFPVDEVVRVSGPDPKTNICLYHAKTNMFGDVEIKTTHDLIAAKSLYLVDPWIRPLLDQEFSRAPEKHDKPRRARRLVARLMQPFGALLFERLSRVEYRRVAADSLIMVQIRKDFSLDDEFMESIRMIDVQ